MEAISWTSAALYAAFSAFVYYQQLHIKNFRGASEGFHGMLMLSAFAGMITGVVYLGYYGWTVTWWAPVVIFIFGFLGTLIAVLLERVVGAMMLSLAGFVGWPVCAYFAFKTIPTASVS